MIGPFVFGVCLSIATAIPDGVACGTASIDAGCAVNAGSARYQASDMTTFVQVNIKREPRSRSIGSSDDASEAQTVDGSSVAAADAVSSESGVGNTGIIEEQDAGSFHSKGGDMTNLMQLRVLKDLRKENSSVALHAREEDEGGQGEGDKPGSYPEAEVTNDDEAEHAEAQKKFGGMTKTAPVSTKGIVEPTSESTVGSRDKDTADDEMPVSGVDGLGKVTADNTASVEAIRGDFADTSQLNSLLLRGALRPVASREGNDITNMVQVNVLKELRDGVVDVDGGVEATEHDEF